MKKPSKCDRIKCKRSLKAKLERIDFIVQEIRAAKLDLCPAAIGISNNTLDKMKGNVALLRAELAARKEN